MLKYAKPRESWKLNCKAGFRGVCCGENALSAACRRGRETPESGLHRPRGSFVIRPSVPLSQTAIKWWETQDGKLSSMSQPEGLLLGWRSESFSCPMRPRGVRLVPLSTHFHPLSLTLWTPSQTAFLLDLNMPYFLLPTSRQKCYCLAGTLLLSSLLLTLWLSAQASLFLGILPQAPRTEKFPFLYVFLELLPLLWNISLSLELYVH